MNHSIKSALLLGSLFIFTTPAIAGDDKHHGGHHGDGHGMPGHHQSIDKGKHGDKHHGDHHDDGHSMAGHHDKKEKCDQADKKQCNKHKAGHKKHKGHSLSPHWAKTLDDQQRVAVDRMHLTLDTEHAILKAKAGVLQQEVNVMTAKDNADQQAIYNKIDELMALKAKIMKLRYDHLTEMREILNEQQRISYDMAILKRKGAK